MLWPLTSKSIAKMKKVNRLKKFHFLYLNTWWNHFRLENSLIIGIFFNRLDLIGKKSHELCWGIRLREKDKKRIRESQHPNKEKYNFRTVRTLCSHRYLKQIFSLCRTLCYSLPHSISNLKKLSKWYIVLNRNLPSWMQIKWFLQKIHSIHSILPQNSSAQSFLTTLQSSQKFHNLEINSNAFQFTSKM